MILLVHSFFIDRMKRSMIEMLPCSPTAPNRGRMSRTRHQFLNGAHQNSFPWSVMMYLGFEPALLIAPPRKAQT